ADCVRDAGGSWSVRLWSHDRAHKFFSAARWLPERLSMLLAKLVVGLLVPADDAVSVVIDDTLFTRAGRRCGRLAGSTTARPRGPNRSVTATTGSLPGSWSVRRWWTGQCACRCWRGWSGRTPS